MCAAVTPDNWGNAKYVLDSVKLNTTELWNNESRFTIILSHGWNTSEKHLVYFSMAKTTLDTHFGPIPHFCKMIHLLLFIVLYFICILLFTKPYSFGSELLIIGWCPLVRSKMKLVFKLAHILMHVICSTQRWLWFLIPAILRFATRCRCTTSTTWPRTQQISI